MLNIDTECAVRGGGADRYHEGATSPYQQTVHSTEDSTHPHHPGTCTQYTVDIIIQVNEH